MERKTKMREDLYSTGEFAKKANVSVRTIHFYEKKGLIHPRLISESKYRYYGEQDFALLQKIVCLKNLGFTLDEIQAFSLRENDSQFVQESLDLQLKLVNQKITQLELVREAIGRTADCLRQTHKVDWKDMARLIKMMNMENEIVEQYKNGRNIKARIDLHEKYSHQTLNWFAWIGEQIEWEKHNAILEVGCGTGDFWLKNQQHLTKSHSITVSDISPGIVDEAKERLDKLNAHFIFGIADVSRLPYADETFDLVIANHVMFYVQDTDAALQEIKRVLRPGGKLYVATYGEKHMKEIEQLVKRFDEKIVLSSVPLYDNFGLENGQEQCRKYFKDVARKDYDDYLEVTQVQALMDYILSCHGNQKEYILPKLKQFNEYLSKQLCSQGAFHITKQAGLIVCQK